MSIYPCRQDLRPVDPAADPPIVPTQLIAHVAVAWVSGSGPGYHDGLDWHFYVASGPGRPEDLVTQLRDTGIQADANFRANGPRADGSGAASFESEGDGSTPWDDDQVAAIIWLCRRANEIDGIPLEMCPGPDDPGLGYHRLYNDWNNPYHSCPGDLKVAQFRDLILPELQKATPAPTPDQLMEARMLFIINDTDEKTVFSVDTRSGWFCKHVQNVDDLQRGLNAPRVDVTHDTRVRIEGECLRVRTGAA